MIARIRVQLTIDQRAKAIECLSRYSGKSAEAETDGSDTILIFHSPVKISEANIYVRGLIDGIKGA